jgi:folate-dependent phosphoribosylglycinamide formyltransferase PurN
MRRVVVLISGSGTNLKALIDATTKTKIIPRAEIVHVISNKREASGLKFADEAKIPTSTIVWNKKLQTRVECVKVCLTVVLLH